MANKVIKVTNKKTKKVKDEIIGGSKVDMEGYNEIRLPSDDVNITLVQEEAEFTETSIVAGDVINFTDKTTFNRVLIEFVALIEKSLPNSDAKDLHRTSKELQSELNKTKPRKLNLEKLLDNLKKYIAISQLAGQAKDQVEVLLQQMVTFVHSLFR